MTQSLSRYKIYKTIQKCNKDDDENLFSVIKNFAGKKTCYFVLPGKTEIDGEIFDTYGIGAIENNEIADYIFDLSKDFESVKSFVGLCNAKRLSLTHLRDAVEDFLTAIT